MKANWATQLFNNQKDTWTFIPQKYFENCKINLMLWMNAANEKHIPIKLPIFYREEIHSWHLCGGGQKASRNVADIRQEILWGNRFIQSKGKTLLFKHWKESRINFIDDLINEEGKFLSGEEIFTKLNKTNNWLAEYNIILKSIPDFWKES